MKVKDVIDIAKFSTLSNLSLIKNEDALLKIVYMGVSELYRRFNLNIKVETILTNPDLALWELKNKDVNMLIAVYDSKGNSLAYSDILNGKPDYKRMSYKSFLLRCPKDELLFAIYNASPAMFTSVEDEIELPDAMLDALLAYIGYISHNSINRDNMVESGTYMKKFDSACQELELQGYRIDLNTETLGIKLKGYI